MIMNDSFSKIYFSHWKLIVESGKVHHVRDIYAYIMTQMRTVAAQKPFKHTVYKQNPGEVLITTKEISDFYGIQGTQARRAFQDLMALLYWEYKEIVPGLYAVKPMPPSAFANTKGATVLVDFTDCTPGVLHGVDQRAYSIPNIDEQTNRRLDEQTDRRIDENTDDREQKQVAIGHKERARIVKADEFREEMRQLIVEGLKPFDEPIGDPSTIEEKTELAEVDSQETPAQEMAPTMAEPRLPAPETVQEYQRSGATTETLLSRDFEFLPYPEYDPSEEQKFGRPPFKVPTALKRGKGETDEMLTRRIEMRNIQLAVYYRCKSYYTLHDLDPAGFPKFDFKVMAFIKALVARLSGGAEANQLIGLYKAWVMLMHAHNKAVETGSAYWMPVFYSVLNERHVSDMINDGFVQRNVANFQAQEFSSWYLLRSALDCYESSKDGLEEPVWMYTERKAAAEAFNAQREAHLAADQERIRKEYLREYTKRKPATHIAVNGDISTAVPVDSLSVEFEDLDPANQQIIRELYPEQFRRDQLVQPMILTKEDFLRQ